MGENTNKTFMILMIISIAVAILFLVLYLNERAWYDSENVYAIEGDALLDESETDLDECEADLTSTINDYNQLVSDSNQLHRDWQDAEVTLLNCYENNLDVCNYYAPTWE